MRFACIKNMALTSLTGLRRGRGMGLSGRQNVGAHCQYGSGYFSLHRSASLVTTPFSTAEVELPRLLPSGPSLVPVPCLCGSAKGGLAGSSQETSLAIGIRDQREPDPCLLRQGQSQQGPRRCHGWVMGYAARTFLAPSFAAVP